MSILEKVSPSEHSGDEIEFDLATINAQLASGQLLPDDLCWSEAQPVWQALTLLDGVQPPAPRPGPPTQGDCTTK